VPTAAPILFSRSFTFLFPERLHPLRIVLMLSRCRSYLFFVLVHNLFPHSKYCSSRPKCMMTRVRPHLGICRRTFDIPPNSARYGLHYNGSGSYIRWAGKWAQVWLCRCSESPHIETHTQNPRSVFFQGTRTPTPPSQKPHGLL
jgi:hypothetical protein